MIASKLAELRALRQKASAYKDAPIIRTGGLRISRSFDSLPDDEQLELAQEGSTILYAATRIIAVAVSSPPLVAEVRGKDGWDQLEPDHPASLIVKSPNAFDDGRSLMERLAISLIVTGNHLQLKRFGVKKIGADKRVVSVWPLLPVYQAEEGDDGYPIKYKPKTSGLGRHSSARSYDPEEVIHYQRVNTRDLGWGTGVVAASRRVIQSELATAEWQQSSYDNRMVPEGALISTTKLEPGPRAAIEEALAIKAGPSGARETLLLDGGEFTYERFGFNAVEADFLGTRRALLEEMCAAVNLRPALLVPDAKYANLEQSRKSLWLDNVLPMLAAVCSKLSRHLGPHFGQPGEIRWRANTEEVEALRELMGERMLSFQRAVRNGIPYNDAVALFAIPVPLLAPGVGDIPFGASEAIMLDRIRAEEGLVRSGGDAGKDAARELWPRARVRRIAQIRKARLALPAPRSKQDAQARTAELTAAARRLERELVAAYRALAARLAPDDARLKLIARALLDGDASSAALAAGVPILRAGLGLPSTSDAQIDGPTLLEVIGAGARDGVALGAEALSEAAGVTLAVPPEVADSWVAGWAPERMQDAVASTERGLAETLTEWRGLTGWGAGLAAALAGVYGAMVAIDGQQAGSVRKVLAGVLDSRGIDEAVRRAQRLVERAIAARADLLGQHNATRATFGGQQQAASDLYQRGAILGGRRAWVDSGDGNVCPICAGLDGEEAELDGPYFSPADGGEYWTPGDPHPKCRCGELYFEIEVSEAA